MTYDTHKVTNIEKQNNDVKSAPDRLRGTANQNKDVFDKLVELFIGKYNDLIDSLDSNVPTGTSPITVTGSAISHDDSGATAGTYGRTSQTPTAEGSFIVPMVTVDAKGHITSASEETVTLPNGDKTYTHTQSVPASTWTVEHDLNKLPSVHVFDSTGEEVYGDISYDDLDNVTLTFSGAFSGKAIFN